MNYQTFFENILNECTYIVSNNEENKIKPWWNEKLEIQVKVRKEKLLKYKDVVNFENYIDFKRETAKLRKMTKIAKKEFNERYIESIAPSTNLTELWKKVKWLSGKKNEVIV